MKKTEIQKSIRNLHFNLHRVTPKPGRIGTLETFQHEGSNMPKPLTSSNPNSSNPILPNQNQLKTSLSVKIPSSKVPWFIRQILGAFAFFFRCLCCCFCFCINRHKRKQNLVRIKTKLYQLSILSFFTHLVLILRAMKRLRERTGFRKLGEQPTYVLDFIDDKSQFDGLEKQKKYHNVAISFLYLALTKKLNKKMKKGFRRFLKKTMMILGVIKQWAIKLANIIPVIKPNQPLKIVWDLFVVIIIYIYFHLIPMQIGFDFFYDEEIEKVIEEIGLTNIKQLFILLPEIILWTDSVLKLITGIYVNGVIVEEKEVILKHYIKSGLIYDSLAYFPIMFQGFWKSFFSSLNPLVIKMLQLMMFCKLKRVHIALSNFEEIVSSKGKHDYWLSGLRLLLNVYFISHLNACAWHALAYYNPFKNEENWLKASDLLEEEWGKRYVLSMYFSVGIMVNSGNFLRFSPQNTIECMYMIFVFLSSAGLFGYIIFSIKEIFEIKNKKSKEYKEAIRIINGYMKNKSVNFELQSRVRKYLEFVMNKDINDEQENEILGKLNKSLKNEVILQSRGKTLFQSSLFSSNFSSSLLASLSLKLKRLTFSPEEFVYKQKTLNDSVYIVEHGVLEEVLWNLSTVEGHKPLKKIKVFSDFISYNLRIFFKTGEVFGSFSFFTDEPRENSVISKEFSSILELKKEDFLNIIRENQEDYVVFALFLY